ncbi:MAG: ABC transporter substrate-binding protein [Neptunomonas phycophila]|uniref:ABC transporter substrate-binding protein n=1 Tax=Neptunomonas phycophila TaxID=1572645 RepID=UPI003B8DCED9
MRHATIFAAFLTLMYVHWVSPIMAMANDETASTYPIVVTDIMGREVTIEHEPQGIILGTGRISYALDLLLKEKMFDHVVAWRTDLIRNDHDAYQAYLERFPSIADLPTVGLVSTGSFDVEYALGLPADLLILEKSDYPVAQETGLTDILNSVGIKTLFIDFKEDPFTHTAASIRLLGDALNVPNTAKRYVDFYTKRLQQLQQIAASIPTKRRVFIEKAAGINGLAQCCRTWGDSNFGKIAEAAGLINIGTHLLPGATGELTVEKVLIENPDLYVITGTNWSSTRPNAKNIPLGYSVSTEQALSAFPALISRPGLAELDAVKRQQVYALFHDFFNSPFNIIAAQYFAYWAYPEHYPDLDPAAEFRAIHDEFLNLPYRGTFAIHYQPSTPIATNNGR